MMSAALTSVRLEKIAWWSLLAAAFLMPPATSNFSALRFIVPGLSVPLTVDQTALPTLTVLLIALDVGLMCWALSVALEGRAVRWHPVWGIMMLFMVLGAVAWVFSVDFSTSLFGTADRRVGFLTIMLYGGAGWLTLQMADSSRRVRQLALTVVIAGTLQSVYGILQTLGLDPTDWGVVPWEADRAFGTLGNPDTFGNYLAIVLPLAVVLALTARSLRFKFTWWAAAAAISMGITLSFARGAWLGAAAGLLVLGFASLRLGVRPDRADRIAIGLAVTAAVATAALTLTGLTSYSVAERILSAFRPGEGSFETRLFIWRAALDGIAQRPLFGWGPDAFVYLWYAHRPAADVALHGGAHIADDAHNYVLQLAATRGIPSAIAFVVGVGGALAAAAPDAFSPGRTSRLPYAGWFAALVGYVVALMVSITSVAATVLLWVTVALLIAPRSRPVSVSKPIEWVAVAGLLTALLAVSVPFSRVLYANHLAARASTARSFDLAQAYTVQASRAAPWNHNYRLDLADLRLEEVEELIPRLENATGASAEELRSVAIAELAQAEREYADAAEEVPYDYWAASGEVNAAIVRGDLGESEAYARGVRLADEYARRFPTDAELPLLAAYAEYRMGDIGEALRRFEQVRTRYPDLPNVRSLGAQLGVE